MMQSSATRADERGQRETRPRVLVVDDDDHLLAVLRRALSLRGFEPATAHNAAEALPRIDDSWPDVIVLDIMMPGMDGLSLCQRVREGGSVPILMLTALDSVPDRVAGLQSGADDYLVKPFALDELVARLQALLRRVAPEPRRETTLSYADLVVDSRAWLARRGDAVLTLTATEFRLLEYFLTYPEQVVTREEVLMAIRGDETVTESNVVDVHVANLRQKLEAAGGSRLIRTVRGVGYMLKEG